MTTAQSISFTAIPRHDREAALARVYEHRYNWKEGIDFMLQRNPQTNMTFKMTLSMFLGLEV